MTSQILINGKPVTEEFLKNSSGPSVVDYADYANDEYLLIKAENTKLVKNLDRLKQVAKRLEIKINSLVSRNKTLGELATIDPLTELNNRRSLEDRFHKFKRKLTTSFSLNAHRKNEEAYSEKKPALLYIDLFDFRGFNTLGGHQLGDEALKLYAQVIKEETRDTEFAARVGGDEFAIFIRDNNDNAAQKLAERLNRRFDELVIEFEGCDIKLMATIGIAEIDKDDDLEASLDKADAAMYEEKARQQKQYPKAACLQDHLDRHVIAETGINPNPKEEQIAVTNKMPSSFKIKRAPKIVRGSSLSFKR